MKINYAKEPNEAHKNNLKEDILQVINENFIEMILDMVNQNVQETLEKFQDNKNRESEKAQEEIIKKSYQEGCYIMTKVSIHQQHITIINIHAPNNRSQKYTKLIEHSLKLNHINSYKISINKF
jgi:aspartyl/asparaginyl-tRNA synthetase